MSNVIKHPSSQQRRSEIIDRFMAIRKSHDAAVNRMWAGTLALAFTDEELSLIPDYLCPNDQSLLAATRDPRKIRRKKAAR